MPSQRFLFEICDTVVLIGCLYHMYVLQIAPEMAIYCSLSPVTRSIRNTELNWKEFSSLLIGVASCDNSSEVFKQQKICCNGGLKKNDVSVRGISLGLCFTLICVFPQRWK